MKSRKNRSTPLKSVSDMRTTVKLLSGTPEFSGERCEELERNLIVHVAARAPGAGAGRGRDLAGRPGRAELPTLLGPELAAASPAGAARTGAVEQRQLAAEALQHHFGRVAVLAGLILPFARLQLAFDENLRAFLEIAR